MCVCARTHTHKGNGRATGGPCGWNSGKPAFDCLSYQLYSPLWTFSLLTFVDLIAGERSVRTGEEYAAAAAAAESLQSCPTLCDPIDGSPPGSPVPGILQARTLEWVAMSFSGEEYICPQMESMCLSTLCNSVTCYYSVGVLGGVGWKK